MRNNSTSSRPHLKWLSDRVSSKLEEGNYKGAVRLACSEDTMADHSDITLSALRLKHPPPHPESNIVQQDFDNPLPFPVDLELITKSIASFPNGSGGGSDGLLPQHLKDLSSQSAGDGAHLLLQALVGLLTLILEGRTPRAIGATLIALQKKSGGIRPITIGCTLRRLAAKCASLHALKSIPQLLAPTQLGFGVPRGIEAAVHAARVYLGNLPQHHGLLKIDFTI